MAAWIQQIPPSTLYSADWEIDSFPLFSLCMANLKLAIHWSIQTDFNKSVADLLNIWSTSVDGMCWKMFSICGCSQSAPDVDQCILTAAGGIPPSTSFVDGGMRELFVQPGNSFAISAENMLGKSFAVCPILQAYQFVCCGFKVYVFFYFLLIE